ncbi:GNAT family N-acetyltransferase [Streptomyces sp. MB09-01]|uniref:GNAT family N-acetyltransferase n=1 Tax=Streptomyces sp. MB09-01 TaxID=3028666 RepID=UPI0029AE1C79|nr:GNAT family N-acetyltransferase [Streptomyces sp. MB09-01]MDX3534534.1 GNAT family N-acetyltransferase [Streptomyces sp. MB09-01]
MTDQASLPHPIAVRLARYTQTEQSEILGDGPDPFGVAGAGLTWLPKEEHFGVRQGDRLVAHAGLLRLPLSIGGVDTEVMGVGGVAVAPDVRGRGLARAVLTAALDHARTTGLQHALLFCRPPLVPLYQRLGWRTLDQEVRVEQPGGTVTMPLRTMTVPLRADAHWLDGPVHLRSLPM